MEHCSLFEALYLSFQHLMLVPFHIGPMQEVVMLVVSRDMDNMTIASLHNSSCQTAKRNFYYLSVITII